MTQRELGDGWPDWAPPDDDYTTEKEASRRVRRAAALAAVIFGALGFGAGAVWGQGFYRCEPPDRVTITDDGPDRAIVTFYNSINDCSNNVDRVMESDNGIAVRVVIKVGSAANEYRETITLEPQNPMMMAFPPEGDLLDGEERRFVIQGGVT